MIHDAACPVTPQLIHQPLGRLVNKCQPADCLAWLS
jgi:hypothetical protein